MGSVDQWRQFTGRCVLMAAMPRSIINKPSVVRVDWHRLPVPGIDGWGSSQLQLVIE